MVAERIDLAGVLGKAALLSDLSQPELRTLGSSDSAQIV
jgi:hypothetical protein